MNNIFTKTCCIALLAMVLNGTTTYAQTVINESFDYNPAGTTWPNTNLPFGWSQIKISLGADPDNFWERINNTATLPTCTPRTGVGMLCYRSQLADSGVSAIVSRKFDLRAIPVGGTTVSFWMYRDNGSAGVDDNIQVFINTTPAITGATPLNTGPSPTIINRPCASAPAVACLASYNVANWYQYTYNIPNTFNTVSNYIIIQATDYNNYINLAPGQNIYIDDFSIGTYPNNQSYVPATATTMSFQNTANVGPGTFNNMVAGIRITVDGEANRLFCDSIGFSTNGSTSPFTDIVANSAKLWWTAGTSTFSILGAQQHGLGQSIAGTNFYFYPTSLVTPTYTAVAGVNTITVSSVAGLAIGMSAKGLGIANGAVITAIATPIVTLSINNTANAGALTPGRFSTFFLHNGDNYFWLTFDVAASPPAIAGNCIDAEYLGFEVGAIDPALLPVAASGGVTTIAGCREIDVVYCPGGLTPFYFVGTSWLNGSYTNNDYIRAVTMDGVVGYPWLNNQLNSSGPPAPFSRPGAAPISWYSNHPPDYELFDRTLPGKTTTLQISAQTTINTTLGSNVIVVGSTLNLSVGMYAFGSGIPAPLGMPTNTNLMPFITSIVGFNVTLSAAATLTGSGTGTFGGYPTFLQVGDWSSSNYIAAWIDFNRDGTFNDNPWTTPGGEQIAQSPSFTSLFGQTFYFQVPPGAFIGNTTLRVREIFATSNCTPCNSATYGETEDYSISITGFCPSVPTYKTWLGFTDDWNSGGNWCPPGIPTSAQNVRIPNTGGAGYVSPVIKAGVSAACNKLRIEGADSLTIDAYKNGGLAANDSIFIQSAGGKLKVVSSYNATAIMGVGTLFNFNFNPFKSGSYRNHKVQMLYTQAELLAKGLVAGDVITQIKVPVISITGGALAQDTLFNLQISYYYTNLAPGFAASPNLAPITTAGGIVFPTANHKMILGDNIFTLSTPIIWNGGAQKLVIEICYSNPTNVNGYKTARIEQTSTGLNYVGDWGDLANANPGCVLTFANSPQKYGGNLRPNLRFVYTRPYSKVPISLKGHWGNNGTFTPGYSRVTFDGTLNQNIAGTSNTNFYDLVINNTAGVTQVTAAALIGDTLNLINGAFRLNGLTFTHNNNLSNSVIKTNGWLHSENLPPNYGKFRWIMNGDTDPHVFPFATSSALADTIPFTYDPVSGTDGDVTVATYTTIPANTPWPTGVLGINGFYTGTDNSANMVDRFWQIDNAGTSPVADIKFTFRAAEIAANGNTNPRAQRWNGPKWADPVMFIGQSNPTTRQVLVPGVTQFSPWAITMEAQPLPIELLDFSAKKEKEKVRLIWSTASEINNDYFTIERTQNQNEYSFIDKVQSRGPSSSLLEYYTYDYRPLNGLQYYRLKQTDFDGTSTYSKLVPVTFGKENFEIITVINENDEVKNILFNYDADGMLNIRLIDIMGKIVLEKLNFKAVNGINQFSLSSKLNSGIYTIFIFDNSRTVSRKLIY